MTPPPTDSSRSMNTLYLEPNDVLFFRDGRPMSGSLSGHGAAWPLPTVTNAALHAALHRAMVDGSIRDTAGAQIKVHGHDHHRRSGESVADVRKFGSLVTVGPFPASADGKWYFPRPLDANAKYSTSVTFLPLATGFDHTRSSLQSPLRYPVANTACASKERPCGWWSHEAWQAYLGGNIESRPHHFKDDRAFSETEHTFGIGIDPGTGTQNGEQFYSAQYLRLKPGWRLGLLAEAPDKIDNNPANKRDLIQAVFPNSGGRTAIVVGGQQRICTVMRSSGEKIPLPLGQTNFAPQDGKYLVKWVLLTPAIFPKINDHPGGLLPSWVRHSDGQVMLKTGNTPRAEREGRHAWRMRVAAMDFIKATLVAAMVEKPMPVAGFALPNPADPGRAPGGKSTHLAVPAGSIYYFECQSGEDAAALAAALNWHGTDREPHFIRNRRSTLFGEKGFGIGVCGSWNFHYGKIPA